MQLLDLTLDVPAANLALEEALLDDCDAGELAGGVLRFWESPVSMVVVGRGSRLAEEVNLDACREMGVPVLRRVSGGMAIVAGPGCLMYAVIAPHSPGAKADIAEIHQQVLARLARSLQRLGSQRLGSQRLGSQRLGSQRLSSQRLGSQRLGASIRRAGTSDLAIIASDGLMRKVSGNSLRVARGAYLYHGTLLYDFDLPLITRCLRSPPRAPDYRAGRVHSDFVANLPLSRDALIQSIAESWEARDNLKDWPRERVQELVATRYALDEWNKGR